MGNLMRDLFISYSHHDIKWVKDFLIPMIESWQLTYAIDHADFLPGRPLASTINEFISTSKHVLFICTENFLASKFCQEELEQVRFEDPGSFNRKAIPIVLSEKGVPPLLKGAVWCNLSIHMYDIVQWKRLCKSIGGKWSNASDRILTSQNDLLSFFGNIRDNEVPLTILTRSHSINELAGISKVLSAEAAIGLSHIYAFLAEIGKTQGIQLVLSDSKGKLNNNFNEKEQKNLIVFGQTSQGNRILHRISNGLIRYKESKKEPKYCYEIKGHLFVPNQNNMTFLVYKTKTELNNTILVLFSPWTYANGFAAKFFAANYWTFVNKIRENEFFQLYELKGVNETPELILSKD